MKHFIRKPAALLLVTLFISLLPVPKAIARSTSSYQCQNYVYLPSIINGNGSTAQGLQLDNRAQVNSPTNEPDFNGDGCADLAIGVPRETIDSINHGGMVQVMYGSSHGVRAENSQVWHRGGGYDVEGNFLGDIQGEFQGIDFFGESLATGDFNNDGYTDLAVGVQLAFASAHPSSGAVHILFGSVSGLAAANNQYWTQDGGWVDMEGDGQGIYLGDIYGGSEDSDLFGCSLTVGNFNGDDYADLAIGVDHESIGNIEYAGAVNILYGTADGLTWVGNQLLSQNEIRDENDGSGTYTYIGDLIAHAEEYDYFGHALASGNFNGDGYDDLVIGVWGEGIGDIGDAGAIHIVKGSAGGLTAYNNEHWHQQAAYLDTDGDGSVDVTIGNPYGLEEIGDFFGYSLAAGDFNGDAFDDLAVGVPNEAMWIDGILYRYVGVAQVFYGSSESLTLTNEQFWQQNGEYSLGYIEGNDPGDGDRFGTTLTTGDINGDGYSELIVGAPNESFTEIGSHVGSVNVIYGSSAGLTLSNHLWFYQDQAIGADGSQMGNLVGEASFNNYFGQALTVADFDKDGYKELVVGVPGYKLGDTLGGVGAINILKGSGDGLVITGNQLWHQDGGWDDEGNFLGDLFDTAEIGDYFGKGLP